VNLLRLKQSGDKHSLRLQPSVHTVLHDKEYGRTFTVSKSQSTTTQTSAKKFTLNELNAATAQHRVIATSATSNAVFSSTENAGNSSKRKMTVLSFFHVFTMHNIHNAVDDMIQDMDLQGHYKGEIIEDGNAYVVAVTACINPQKQVAFRVALENERVRVRIVHQSQISPLFAQLILENLAIQLDPNYFM
jgi:hypothetical protein